MSEKQSRWYSVENWAGSKAGGRPSEAGVTGLVGFLFLVSSVSYAADHAKPWLSLEMR